MPAVVRVLPRLALAFAMAVTAALLMTAAAQAAQVTGNAGPPVVAAPVTPVTTTAMPEWVKRPMQVIDPVTLRAEGTEIRLWGIQPVETTQTPIGLRAIQRVDQLITGQVVNCHIEGGTYPALTGRCTTASGDDLALTLLNEGLAVRNLRQVYNTPFAQAYGQAEEMARTNAKGVWAYLADDSDKDKLSPGLLIGLLVGVPSVGFVLMGLLMWAMLQKQATAQKMEFARARKKESALQDREKSVLVSILEGELTENKNKVEAFLSIYSDMLHSLRDLSETPKYQLVGDIIQRHPSFSHVVFDSNVNKLSVLGIQLAGRVSKLYAALPRTQEYINLDPNVPLETAIKLVEKTVEDAKTLADPITTVLNDLQNDSKS